MTDSERIAAALPLVLELRTLTAAMRADGIDDRDHIGVLTSVWAIVMELHEPGAIVSGIPPAPHPESANTRFVGLVRSEYVSMMVALWIGLRRQGLSIGDTALVTWSAITALDAERAVTACTS